MCFDWMTDWLIDSQCRASIDFMLGIRSEINENGDESSFCLQNIIHQITTGLFVFQLRDPGIHEVMALKLY